MTWAISISGTYDGVFSDDETGDYPHSIINISPIQATLDPLEPLIDSSPFSVTLAADAKTSSSYVSPLSSTVAEFFLRDPGVLGKLTRNYVVGDQYIWADGELDGLINIGPCVYDTYLDEWVGSETRNEIYPTGYPSQMSNHYVDTTLGIAPVISDRPITWKGRLVWLLESGTLRQYRVCYLTDNPVFGINTVELRMAPLDARIRDHHAVPLTPSVAHFAPSSMRTYVRGQRTKRIAGYLSDGGIKIFSSGTSSISSQSLTTSGITYTGVANSIQTTTTTPGGVPLEGNNEQRIWTPASPALYKTSTNWQGIIGFSSPTLYFFTTMIWGADGGIIETQPAIRFYVSTNSSGVPVADLRGGLTYSSTTKDPNFAINYGDEGTITVPWIVNSSSQVGANTPAPYIVFVWAQNEVDTSYHSPYTSFTFAGAIRHYFGVTCPNAASVKGDYNLDWLITNELDLYSVKPINAATKELVYDVHSNKVTRNGQGELRSVTTRTPVTQHCAAYQCKPSTQVTLAQASAWWCPGERDIVLDTQFCAVGASVWMTANWTEDGGTTYFERHFKVTYVDSPASGVHRYEIGDGLDTELTSEMLVGCAGIGDWFGYRATFTPDRVIEGADDSSLMIEYFGVTPFTTSLFIPLYYVDEDSFSVTAHRLPLINSWKFADPEALDENLAAMLALNSTCISFDFDKSSNYYKIARRWCGAPYKDEPYTDVTDDDLLEPPTASLSEEILADYKLTFAGDQTVTYSDTVAKALYNAEKTFELDLSGCRLNSQMTNVQLGRAMIASLMNLVNRFGAEYQTYSLQIPFSLGCDLAPGSVVRLSSNYVIGQIGSGWSARPNNLLCRVLDVTQDLVGQRTSLRVIAETKTTGRYQAGSRIIGGWNTATLTVDDTSWCANGMSVRVGQYSLSISSFTTTTITLNSSTTGYSAHIYATSLNNNRFVNASDYLG